MLDGYIASVGFLSSACCPLTPPPPPPHTHPPTPSPTSHSEPAGVRWIYCFCQFLISLWCVSEFSILSIPRASLQMLAALVLSVSYQPVVCFRIRDVQFSVALYTVLSFAVIGYEDVFTIFASTTTDYSKFP